MRFATCITAFLLFLTVVSSSFAQHLTSAKLYLQQRQYEKAEASALKAVEKDPDDEEAWFVLGKTRYEVRKYADMVKAFEKSAALKPDEYKTEIGQYRLKVWADMYNAGIKMYNRGRDSASYFQAAVDSFQLAIVARPESLQTYYVCALAYYGNKQTDQAIQILNVSLQHNPKSVKELELLGKLHLQVAREKETAKDSAGSEQEYLSAIATFEKLYEADPANTENMIRLMELYQQVGMSEKALAMTHDALAADPNNAYLHFADGVFLLKQNKFEESIEQLKKALELSPDPSVPLVEDATYNLGVAYLNWGVAMKAAEDQRVEAAIKSGKGKDVKEDLSYKKKYEMAVPYLEESTQKKGNDISLWQQLGKLYANLNRMDKMKRAFAVVDSLMKGN